MQISQPPTFQQQHVLHTGPVTSNWANGFREHITQTAPRAQQSAPSPQAFQHMARYGMNSYQNSFAQPSFASTTQSKGKEALTEQFDEAAFERAFDQAKADMMAEEMDIEEAAYETGASTGNYEDHVDKVRREAMAAIHEHKRRLSIAEEEMHHLEHVSDPLERLESDPIADEMLREEHESAIEMEDEQTDSIKQQEDDDALAMTAQELLEKVEHNKTDKFRNSQFLSLMRRLRDREVKVEGDKMVETSTVRLAPVVDSNHKAPPTSAPDSAYVSGTGTPEPHFDTHHLAHPRTSPPPEFDTHLEYGWSEEHEFDHWESPYR